MKIKTMFLCCLILSLFIWAGFARAEDAADPCKDVPPLVVTSVDNDVELGNDIFVTVKNLPAHIKCGKDPSKFKLYLDWIKIDQVNSTLVGGRKESKKKVDGKQGAEKKDAEKTVEKTPVSAKQKVDEGILLFKIEHGDSDNAKKAWAALFGKPFLKKGEGLKTGVIVSVGYDDEAPVAFESKEKKNATLVVVQSWHLGLFIAVMLVVLVLLICLSVCSGILRGPFRDIPVRERPFSLGRTQMAFWFFLVASSYFFIWMITGNLNTITGSVLTLIGISTATYLSAAALSSDKDKQALAKRQKLRKDIDVLVVTLDELGKRIKNTPTSKTKKDLENQVMEKTIEKRLFEEELDSLIKNLKSNGILKDLVSDANGVSLNRFQIAIWTGVLGIIFVISVLKSMAMPQFDTTLLALMGISGGTYIGFKFPGGKAGQGGQEEEDKKISPS